MSLVAQLALSRGDFRLELSLSVEAGQTVALVGPNGSGKSTVVEALAGLLPIDEGEIVLDDELLESPDEGVRVGPQERPVGVMFQGLWLFPHLSVQDNVAYGLRARGAGRRVARAAVREWLERLDLISLAERRPAQLSGGEAQRVALARALAPQPRLLLLDEPLSALDFEARPRTRAFLQEVLAEFSGPRLVITHEPLEALLLADRVVVLERGRVAQEGPTEELRRRPQTRYVANLAGVNLLTGTLERSDGGWLLCSGEHRLPVASAELEAGTRVHATVHPGSVRLVRADASASAHSWTTTIASLQLDGDRVRVELTDPPGFFAELRADQTELRRFRPGSPVRASVSPKDLDPYPTMKP